MGQYIIWLVVVAICIACIGQGLGRLEIGILSGYSSTLHYLNGNCSWRTTTRTAGFDNENEINAGPHTTLVGGDGNVEMFALKCVTEETIVQLDALIITHNIDAVPSPKSLDLDNDKEILSWRHSFHPDLPMDFEIVHGYSISYIINETDSGERRQTMISHDTSLNISHVLDYCRRQEFIVQTVVNDLYHSQNSSYVTNPSAPVFLSLSSSLLLEEDNITICVKVLFQLEERQCVSQFHIIIDGLVDISFNVTSSDRETREVTYDLSPYISPEEMCTVRGVVYGSNDIGNSSTQTQLQPPGGCSPSVTDSLPTSSTVSGSSTSPTDRPTPPLTNPTSPRPAPTSSPVIVAVTVAVVVVLVSVAIIVVLIFIVIIRRRQRKVGQKTHLVGEQVSAPSPYMYTEVEKEHTYRNVTKPSAPPPVQYSEVVASKGNTFTIQQPPSQYADIDHVETERVRQQCQQARAAAEATATPKSDEAVPKELCPDPAIVGLSHESHYDLLLAALLPLKPRWFDLGMNLDLSENFLDETETNMDTEEECLSEMINNWLLYHQPSMEILNNALSQLNLPPITFNTASREFVLLPNE